jgi:hypothetical protein
VLQASVFFALAGRPVMKAREFAILTAQNDHRGVLQVFRRVTFRGFLDEP